MLHIAPLMDKLYLTVKKKNIEERVWKDGNYFLKHPMMHIVCLFVLFYRHDDLKMIKYEKQS